MREVKPAVFLIGRPALDWDAIRRYLREVGGESWADRVQGSETPDGEDLVEFNGRLCYRSWEPGLNANVSRVREDSAEYHHNLLASGHGSPLEHANYNFILHNISRVLTHEIVRHRVGVGISQESMRFVRLTDIPFWFPEWAREDDELMARSKDLLQQMETHQLWMAEHFGLDDDGVPFSEKKHKTSFMRRFAPDGVATGMGWTANIRTLRHIIHARTALAAEEEIRMVCDEIATIMLAEIPDIMDDFVVTEHREFIPSFVKV